jgi:hypothetical protein
MPYLFQNPIINIGVYYDKESMADDPSIHPFDNGIAEYSASTIRDHFDTAEKTAAMFGQRRDMKMCVQVKVPYDEEKFKADPSKPWKYGGYYEVWRDLINYNDVTDDPKEEHALKKWWVMVEQRNVFYEEAETEQEARRIVAEDRIWGPEHGIGSEDTYEFEITVAREEGQ